MVTRLNHRKCVKPFKIKAVWLLQPLLGRNAILKTAARFEIASQINGFERVAWGAVMIPVN